MVPAPVVFVFGARRRCGTAAIRAPSIDADSIVADIIARAGVVTRCVLTRRALVRCVGRAATFRFIWISESSISKVPIVFFWKKPKDSAKHVRPTVGCTNSSESSSRTAIPKGYPNLADRLHTDTPVTIPDATNDNFCQLRVKIFSRDCRPRDSRITQEKHPRCSLFLSHIWRPITCVFQKYLFSSRSRGIL